MNRLEYRLFGKCSCRAVGMQTVLFLETLDGVSCSWVVGAVRRPGIVPQELQVGLYVGDILRAGLLQGFASHVEITRIVLEGLCVRIRAVVAAAGIEEAQQQAQGDGPYSMLDGSHFFTEIQ